MHPPVCRQPTQLLSPGGTLGGVLGGRRGGLHLPHVAGQWSETRWAASPDGGRRLDQPDPRRVGPTRHTMMRFVLMVNKQGQTRLAQYYEFNQMEERCALEAEVIRKCLARTETLVIACRHAHPRAARLV